MTLSWFRLACALGAFLYVMSIQSARADAIAPDPAPRVPIPSTDQLPGAASDVEWPSTENGCKVLAQNMQVVADVLAERKNSPREEKINMIKAILAHHDATVDACMELPAGQCIFKDAKRAKTLLHRLVFEIADYIYFKDGNPDTTGFSVYLSCKTHIPALPNGLKPEGPQVEATH
jgi:hypothetical protein